MRNEEQDIPVSALSIRHAAPTGGLDHCSWQMIMDLVARKTGKPLSAYVIVAVVEGGPTRFGVHYGTTPRARSVLKANLQRCLAELARLAPPAGAR
jgi:hypothetical protein